jgi:hypothetical protein
MGGCEPLGRMSGGSNGSQDHAQVLSGAGCRAHRRCPARGHQTSATATQGQPIIAGQANDESQATTIYSNAGQFGLNVSAVNTGVTAHRGAYGVYASRGTYGVNGESPGTAVLGNNIGSGNGVWGLANNSHNAVVGEQQGPGS